MSQANIAEMTSRNRPTLLTIPREIREEFYKHLLVLKYPITIQCQDRTNDPPQIFLTCHQLYYEAWEYFYSKNVVVLKMNLHSVIFERLTRSYKTHAGLISRLSMDFTTFNGGRRAATHYYRERVESIVRTLVREKKGRGPLLLKELILTYRKVGNPSRQLDRLRGRIGKVPLSHGLEVCFMGLRSAFDKIEGRFMPQRTMR